MYAPNILIDTIPLQYNLQESATENGNKVHRLNGVLSEGGIENRNRRIYPFPLLQREVNRLLEDIGQRRVVGELDHPDDLKIHLDNVSHLITEVHFNDKKVMGTIEIIPETDAGRNLLGLVKAGVNLGISSRAMGSVKQNEQGIFIVQEDLQLLTWDIVAQPSNYSSWLQLAEGAYNKKFNEVTDLDKILDKELGL